MKKFLKITVVIAVIIALICLAQKLDILGFSFLDISEEQLANYSEYYFNQLELDEKKMYARIDEAVEDKRERIFLGTQEAQGINGKIEKVLTAYFYDNPEFYYISNEYTIITRDFRLFDYVILELEYLTDNDYEIKAGQVAIKEVIDDLLNDCIKQGMTDYEKELAIHDALVKHVTYYKYEDINNIPAIKHTAYGALVQKEAVCDGYAKAYKMLLKKVGIDSIIIGGRTENVAHAWNMVELDEKYYHVDVTSDKLDEHGKHTIHAYFNITDETITKTHTIDKTFSVPESTDDEYSYYIKNKYYIKYEDNLYTMLKQIISNQKDLDVLEIKADKRYYAQTIVDALYDLNFNNWRFGHKTNVSYNKIGDIYIFVK